MSAILMRSHDVADGEDLGHVAAHLEVNVNVDEATFCDGETAFLGADLLAIGRAA